MSDAILMEALASGRAEAEARMTEQVRVGAWGEAVNESTLDTTRTFDMDWAGPAQIKFPTLTVSEAEAAGQSVPTQDITAKIPIGAPLLTIGHFLIVDASTVDPSLVGKEFRIAGEPQSGQVTSHRYPVEAS